METALRIAEIVGNLIGPLASWIASLIAAGKSPEEAAEIVRRDIEDRRAQIAANRAAVDDALDRKHADPEDLEGDASRHARLAAVGSSLTRADIRSLLGATTLSQRAVILDELRLWEAPTTPPIRVPDDPYGGDE